MLSRIGKAFWAAGEQTRNPSNLNSPRTFAADDPRFARRCPGNPSLTLRNATAHRRAVQLEKMDRDLAAKGVRDNVAHLMNSPLAQARKRNSAAAAVEIAAVEL